MNDNELTKQELEEASLKIGVITDNASPKLDPRYQFEIGILLMDSPDLLGFYNSLLMRQQIGDVYFKSQEELAEQMFMTKKTFIKRRQYLEALGVIRTERVGKLTKFEFCEVARIPKFHLPKGRSDKEKYLEKLRDKIYPLTEEEKVKIAVTEVRQQTLLEVDEKVEAKVKEIKQKEIAKKKAEEKHFPRDDYAIVIVGYKRVKGIGLNGPEVLRAKRAIKQMFLAGHKPHEIIKCMEFFKRQAVLDENMWMRSWTLETIMKKMPEYKAGKLATVESMEDQYETIIVPKK